MPTPSIKRSALGLILLAALACARSPSVRSFASLPPIAGGTGRLVLYRTTSTDAPMFHPRMRVDGEPVGKLLRGTFISVDRAPGWHEVTVGRDKGYTAFGDQGTTRPLAVMVEPGDTKYVRVVVLAMGQIQIDLKHADAAMAAYELAPLGEADPPD